MAGVDEEGRALLDLAMAVLADAKARALAELAAGPSPHQATYALHALAIVERDVGRMSEAGRHLRRGLTLASRNRLPERAADMSATLGSVLAYAGRRAAAMGAFDEALAGSRGVDRGRVLVRRAAIRGLLLGDHAGSIEDGNRAIRILHRQGTRSGSPAPSATAPTGTSSSAGSTRPAPTSGERPRCWRPRAGVRRRHHPPQPGDGVVRGRELAVELMAHDRATAAIRLAYMESAAAGAALDAGGELPGRCRGRLPAPARGGGGRPLPRAGAARRGEPPG